MRLLYKIVFTIGLMILFSSVYGCCTFSTTPYVGEISGHFNGVEFINQGDVKMKDEIDLLTWVATRERGFWPKWIPSKPGEKPFDRVGEGKLRVTFVNHSTVLLQFDGLNILTDPVWSYRVSPVFFAGPTRRREPGLKFKDLPEIDYVLISHNHYDHFDIPTIKQLYKNFDPTFIVPLGNRALLNENSIEKVIELDWWEEVKLENRIELTCVPAQHFSMRGLCDRNTSLWAGFVIESSEGPIYFSGDTGFGTHFGEVFDKFGPMRFSMLPIGAFKPAKFVAPVHTSPDEAVMAHIILESQHSMGIHWGTFIQADDSYLDPAEYLKKALLKYGITKKEFSLFKHGKGYNIKKLNEGIILKKDEIIPSTR